MTNIIDLYFEEHKKSTEYFNQMLLKNGINLGGSKTMTEANFNPVTTALDISNNIANANRTLATIEKLIYLQQLRGDNAEVEKLHLKKGKVTWFKMELEELLKHTNDLIEYLKLNP